MTQEQPESIAALPVESAQASKSCKFCAEEIKQNAIICRFCNRNQIEDSREITNKNVHSHKDVPLRKSIHIIMVFVLPLLTLLIFTLAGLKSCKQAAIENPAPTINQAEMPAPSAQENDDAKSSAAGVTLDSNVGNLVDQVLEAIQTNDDASINSAIANLNAVQKPLPGDSTEATRLNKIGLASLKAAQYSDAAKMFSLAAQADPSDPKYLSNLGFAEMKAGDLDSAQNHLYSSLAIAPSRSVAWDDLGLVFAKKNDQEKAIASFLVGYRVSKGDTFKYLQSLQGDDDLAVRNAGAAAVYKTLIREKLKEPMEAINAQPDYTKVTYIYGAVAAPGQIGFLGKPKKIWDLKPRAGGELTCVDEPQTEELCADSLSVRQDYEFACFSKYQPRIDELLKGGHLFLLPSGTKAAVIRAYSSSGSPVMFEQVLITSGTRKGQTCFVGLANKIDPVWRDALTPEQQAIVNAGMTNWFITMASSDHLRGDNCTDISQRPAKEQEILAPLFSAFMNCETAPIASGQETPEAPSQQTP